jgi:hypothetical protein
MDEENLPYLLLRQILTHINSHRDKDDCTLDDVLHIA